MLMWFWASKQGVSYNKKFHGKCKFPNFVDCRTSQFMFPKYLESTEM